LIDGDSPAQSYSVSARRHTPLNIF